MHARKKIVAVEVTIDEAFRERLADLGRNSEQRAAMLKDLHLVEAALHADRIIVSLDDMARALFHIPELNTITWVNPVFEKEQIQSWLREGAPPIDRWRLGY